MLNDAEWLNGRERMLNDAGLWTDDVELLNDVE